ncbi:hypothetical protein SK854_19280 [Lentzea sp. BCCO 10_0061]|uniref:Uncharacterized protein n=2 Tax=Lentzea sokolovensis TaxID=3095429 RepID=A0ABU4UXL5_9PSEU|nr:hypothetical protein [Lentzea sp. BCCO 10_0061]
MQFLAAENAPWWRSDEVIGGVAGAVVAAVLTSIITWSVTKGRLSKENTRMTKDLATSKLSANRLRGQLESSQRTVTRLTAVEQKYLNVRNALTNSGVIQHFHQPVLLLGPRAVGKTSLLMQWNAPWERTISVQSTRTHNYATVPVFDYQLPYDVPYAADPDIRTTAYAHLRLRVHDFPGEVSAQTKALEVASQEALQLRADIGQNLGVVLICMFDAVEVVDGISSETNQYYNGDLFQRLRIYVGDSSITIQRLIVVFNKIDLLAKRLPQLSQPELLDRCVTTFMKLLEPLRGACSAEKVCETLTMCDRANLMASQGGPVVKGEAARGMVHAISGPAKVAELLNGNSASTVMSTQFPIVPTLS